MPRKRNRSPPPEKRCDIDDDDFLLDDTQSLSGRSSSQEPQHRNAANARERARMRVLSKAFCRLKTTLPWVPADTKLSKLDTLRLAASYIAHLRALLHDEPRAATQIFPHPLNLAWPFAFQHGGGAAGNCAASPTTGWSPAQSDSPSPSRDLNSTKEGTSTSRENPSGQTLNYHRQEFASNAFGDETGNESCGSSVQYCNNNYPYRENYYEMRSAYSDSMINNIS